MVNYKVLKEVRVYVEDEWGSEERNILAIFDNFSEAKAYLEGLIFAFVSFISNCWGEDEIIEDNKAESTFEIYRDEYYERYSIIEE